ncbi:MAG: EAL domain-containing protein [Acidimicrobiales bacterium]|jgi:diguanylate cyclase (GGDEF)-like protein|nr:EAL domain-containing protein [Acidimicrobiales bacterium]
MDGAGLSTQWPHLRAVLEQVTVPILACDAAGRVTFWNDAFERFHPVPAAGADVASWLEGFRFFAVDGVTPLANRDAPILRSLRGEVVRDYEYSVVAKSGELRFRRANGQQLVGDDGDVLGAVVALHDITDEVRVEAELRLRALYDELTGLPNRALLGDRIVVALERARREGEAVAVLFVDLDHFKLVNDALGHTVGDELLVEVAARLRAAVRGVDTVARLGGDEFVVLCEALDDLGQAMSVGLRALGALDAPVEVDGRDVRVSASIGVAFAADGEGTAELLLRDADTAMYAAKDRGRNRIEVFDARLRDRVLQRLEIERALVHALNRDGLRLVFQPIVDARTGGIVGAEALVRMADDRGELVPPGVFLPVAEQAGLMDDVDHWVLGEAAARAARWVGSGRLGFVACNVSAALIRRGDLLRIVDEAVERHRLPPGALGIEVTESLLVDASDENRSLLAELRTRGLQVGVDDFGTGYASLSYLRDFPFSFVKIDRSFVQGLGGDGVDDAIVEATIRMAHALGRTVTAEGVEERAQADRLRDLGCDRLQGYLFSRPVPAQAFSELLSTTS